MKHTPATTTQQNHPAQLAPTGKKSYDGVIKQFNESGQTIEEFLESIAAAGYSPATINHKKQALKKALIMHAERQGKDSAAVKYQIETIFKRPEYKAVKVDKAVTQDDCLTIPELLRLTSEAPDRARLIILALYQTAARVSELINIKLSDCQQGREGVKITITRGKGNKARTVYMNRETFDQIRATFAGNVFLFETRTGRPLDRSNVFREVQQAGRIIGLENLHPHTIRHTWATNNLDRLGVHKVSRYLGHADIATTSKFYLHNMPTEAEILQTGDSEQWQQQKS